MAGRLTPIITLTTDFGTQDAYVGSLRGVILSINPNATIADITHEIPSFNIAQGAFVIGTACSLFPKGTIHVGVVDPGVGSDRLPILVQTKNYFFVGPDNGLFSMIPLVDTIEAVYRLTQNRYFLGEVSDTFHGRDIFAPVAAHLSRGIPPPRFGPEIKGMSRLEMFQLSVAPRQIRGRIIAIDRFGNAFTNISRQLFKEKVGKKPFTLAVGRHKFTQLSQTYSDVPLGKPVLIVSSGGWLELACYQGALAKKWRLTVGQPVALKIR